MIHSIGASLREQKMGEKATIMKNQNEKRQQKELD
jgi:hypothetical protein